MRAVREKVPYIQALCIQMIFEEAFLLKVSDLASLLSGVVFLRCGCNIGFNIGATNLLLTPSLHCPFLGRDAGITGMGLGIPFHLA